MKLLSVLVLAFCSMSSVNAQYTWTSQVSNTTTSITDVHFAPTGNAIGIYGTSLGQIGRTNDGGLTWTEVYDIPQINSDWTTENIIGAFIDDAQNCVVATNGGAFYNSTNGGTTWNLTYSNAPPFCNSMTESDGKVFVGGSSKVYFSEDVGATWDSVAVSAISSINDISFHNTYGAFVTNSQIFTSADHGDSWSEVSGLPHQYDIRGVAMVSNTTFFTVGKFGEVFGTDDGGVSWSSVVSGTSEDLNDIEFGNATNGIITGANGTVLMTSNGGFDPWDDSPHTASPTSLIRTVHAQNASYAWFANYAGEIYKSPNNGYDIEIIEFTGPDTICFDSEFDFTIKFYASVGDAAYPEFQILLGGYSLFGSYVSYPGIVPFGDTVEFTLSATSTIDNPVDASNAVSIQGYTLDQSFIAWYFPPNSDIYLKGYDPYTVSGPHEFCPGDLVSITASGGDSYSWVGNVDNPFLPTNIVIPVVSTNYLVTIEQEYCTVIDTVFTTLGDVCDSSSVDTIAVPAGEYAFSPNGDNVNDFFVLDYLEGTTNDVRIFNRWGDLLASFTNYNNEDIVWDGTYEGRKVPGGTYFFVVEYESSLSSSGWVQVVE